VRATGAAVLSLFQNLFGLSLGPFLAGALSDAFDLRTALTAISVLGVVSALLFVRASRDYESDLKQFATVRVHSVSTPADGADGAASGEVK
jgi:hypothetical protein